MIKLYVPRTLAALIIPNSPDLTLNQIHLPHGEWHYSVALYVALRLDNKTI
jgi:hypothetical protein